MSENRQDFRYIGSRIPIRDAALKVTGQMQYVADIHERGMLYAKMLFSPVAHAHIRRIDTSKAQALPGVRAVATYLNSPQRRFNSAVRFYEHDIPETERIFDDTVRFVGDRVAAVAADTLEIAQKAIRLIEVEYEPLPHVLDVEKALAPDAYPIHGSSNAIATMVQNAGDVERGFVESDYVFEDRYEVPAVHHCAIEPHVTVAKYDAMGQTHGDCAQPEYICHAHIARQDIWSAVQQNPGAQPCNRRGVRRQVGSHSGTCCGVACHHDGKTRQA